ncbi:MAG: hypothetical protein ABIF09_05470, partial [Gemmatimonadota bacterium]
MKACYLSVCSLGLLACAALSCGDQSRDAQGSRSTRTSSPSGYPIVSIPEGGFRPALYLSDPVKIGARSEATFGLLSDIEVSGIQGIVVMDYQTSELRRFRRSGEELTLLAGPGGGPGE